jgi:hypothetical protein
MIVKLKDRSGRVYLIDGLSRVSFGPPIQWNGALDDKEAPVVRDPKNSQMQEYLSCGFRPGAFSATEKPKSSEYYRISCFKHDGSSFSIESAFEAYIMNDRGKTIEALRL